MRPAEGVSHRPRILAASSGTRPDWIRNLRTPAHHARATAMPDGETVRKKCRRWNTPWQAHGLTFSLLSTPAQTILHRVDALLHTMLKTGPPVIRALDSRALRCRTPKPLALRANALRVARTNQPRGGGHPPDNLPVLHGHHITTSTTRSQMPVPNGRHVRPEHEIHRNTPAPPHAQANSPRRT